MNMSKSLLTWLNAGAIPIQGGKAHACYIIGVIPPTPGSLETPVSVIAIGFHPQKLNMHPSMLSDADMSRLHYYASNGKDFAVDFVDKFLGMNTEQEQTVKREPISTFPPEIDLGIEHKEKVDGNEDQ